MKLKNLTFWERIFIYSFTLGLNICIILCFWFTDLFYKISPWALLALIILLQGAIAFAIDSNRKVTGIILDSLKSLLKALLDLDRPSKHVVEGISKNILSDKVETLTKEIDTLKSQNKFTSQLVIIAFSAIGILLAIVLLAALFPKR